ncbi:MAG: hypothetical protein JW904_05145 [Spirochaetales bacterium]|nr:hypothetical protein [Spirochaetales bacterium]
MKRPIIIFLCILFAAEIACAQNIPKVNLLSYTELPATFYKEGDSNHPTCALSYDGSVAVNMQANFTAAGEGKAYSITTGKLVVFWRNGEILSGKNRWFASEGQVRLSRNGSVAAFQAFLAGNDKTFVDPWGAAVIVKQTDGRSPAKLYDLKDFLKKQDSQIDGARGVSGMDMNADGSLLWVTVPFHKKSDNEYQRSYPIRVAVIEIDIKTNKMTFHSSAASGEQYYPFAGITTNASGKSFSYKGAGPGGKGMYSYLYTGQWVQKFSHYPVTNEAMTGVNSTYFRGGPVIMGTNDGTYVFLYPKERGPILAYNWKSGSVLKFGTAQTGSDSIPSYADGRFASYDGNFIFYKSGSRWVWYDLGKKPGYLPVPDPKARIDIVSNNNVFMSENGTTLMLLQTIGNAKRLVITKVSAP